MALDIRFYEAADTQLGGSIDTGNLLGSILSTGHQSAPTTDFPAMDSEASGGQTNYYFKKFFVRNQTGGILYDPYLYFEGLSDPTELAIARGLSASDTTTAVDAMPTGYDSSDFVTIGSAEDAIPVNADTSDMANNSSQGFWLRFRIAPGQLTEDAVGGVRVRGRTTP